MRCLIVLIVVMGGVLFAGEIKLSERETLHFDDYIGIDNASQEKGTKVATYVLTAKSSIVKISVFRDEKNFTTVEKIDSMIHDVSNKHIPMAEDVVVREVAIKDISTGSGVNRLIGRYAKYTDKTWNSAKAAQGEFLHYINGFLHRSGYSVAFSVLVNDLEVALPAVVKVLQSFTFEVVPAKLSTVQGFYCRSMQIKLFYETPMLYEPIVMVPYKKEHKSYRLGDERGSLISFYFEKDIDALFQKFFNGLIYGEGEVPSPMHPELIEYNGSRLDIICSDMDTPLRSSIDKILTQSKAKRKK